MGKLNIRGSEATVIARGGKKLELNIMTSDALDLKRFFKIIPFGKFRRIELVPTSDYNTISMKGSPHVIEDACIRLEKSGHLEKNPGLSYAVLKRDLIDKSSEEMAKSLE